MKIFQTVQKNFKSIGISANRISFGLYELKHILLYIVAIIMLCIHFVHVAKTAKEHMDSIFMISGTIFILIVYLNSRSKLQAIFKMIDGFEQAINESE